MTPTDTLRPEKWPQNAKLRSIAAQSALNLVDLIAEHEEQLQSVLCEQEEGPVTVGHSIVIDFGKNSQTDKLSFSLKTKDEITSSLTDPDQPDLPLQGREEEAA